LAGEKNPAGLNDCTCGHRWQIWRCCFIHHRNWTGPAASPSGREVASRMFGGG